VSVVSRGCLVARSMTVTAGFWTVLASWPIHVLSEVNMTDDVGVNSELK
jgi:hypothetical protein